MTPDNDIPNDLYGSDFTEVDLPLINKNIKVKTLVPKRPSIDILHDFKWRNNGGDGDVSEVPRIRLTEYVLKYGNLIATINRIYNAFANNIGSNSVGDDAGLDPYGLLYAGTKTNFEYIFPNLLGDGGNLKTVDNNWGEDGAGNGSGDSGPSGDIMKFINNAVQKVGQFVGALSPGVGGDRPLAFSQSPPNSLEISFPLYNTGDTKDAIRNHAFVTLFHFQNLKTQTTFITYIPPKIYKIETTSESGNRAHGGVYMAAAYVKSFKVDSIGTTRTIRGLSGSASIQIPEAYRVSIVFQDMLSPSSNLLEATMGGSAIEVIGINESVQAGIDAVENFPKYLYNKAKEAGTAISPYIKDLSLPSNKLN